MKMFKVITTEGVSFVLALDSEHAAWQGLELCTERGVKLIDVRPHNDDMW